MNADAAPRARIRERVLACDWDRTAELVGRIELGFEPRPTDML